MNKLALSDIARKKRIFAQQTDKSPKPVDSRREAFYEWKRRYAVAGDSGLQTMFWEFSALGRSKKSQLSFWLLPGLLERYFDMKVSSIGVYFVLKRNGVNRLLNGKKTRKVAAMPAAAYLNVEMYRKVLNAKDR